MFRWFFIFDFGAILHPLSNLAVKNRVKRPVSIFFSMIADLLVAIMKYSFLQTRDAQENSFDFELASSVKLIK